MAEDKPANQDAVAQPAPAPDDTKPDKAQPSPPKPDEEESDGILDIILEDLGRPKEPKEAKPAEDQKKDDDEPSNAADDGSKAPEEPPREGDKPAEPGGDQSKPAKEPAQPKVTKKPDIEKIIDDAVRRAVDARPQAKPNEPDEQAKKPAKEDDDVDLANWLPEEVEEYEFAKAAAKAMPEKYGNLPKRIAEFKNKVERYIATESEKDPDRTFDENDDQFSEFVSENRPDIPESDRRKVQRIQLAEEIRRDIRKEKEGEESELRKRVKAIEAEPKVKHVMSSFATSLPDRLSDIQENLLPEDVRPVKGIISGLSQKIKESGVESVKGTIFGDIVAGIYDLALQAGSRFSTLALDGDVFNPKNEMDVWLGNWLIKTEADFMQRGGDARSRTGPNGEKLTFAPRHEFSRLCVEDPAKAATHWCFSDDEVREMLGMTARNLAVNHVARMYGALKKSGFDIPQEKQPKKSEDAQKGNKPPAKPANKEQKSPAVVPGAIPAPGAKTGADNRQETWDMLDTLGVPKITRT